MKKAFLIGAGSVSALLGYNHYRNLKENSEIPENPDFKLKLVQIVFRHGARTPLSSPEYLPKVKYEDHLLVHGDHTYIPYNTKSSDGNIVDISKSIYKHDDPDYGKHKHGELTAKGAEQMYQLGCYLRKHYVTQTKFLSPESPDEISVRSTSVKRAVESARCTLAGLYPNLKTPIPIEIAELKSEVLFPNFRRCKYLASLTRWSWYYPDLIDGMKEETIQLQTALGIPAETKVHIVTLRDCLAAHHFHGLLPENFNLPEILRRIDQAAVKVMDHVFAGYNHTRETALTLGIGPLLKLFVENMQFSMDQTSSTKLRMYSGHDTTLMPLLHALGIHDTYWTPYGANITLELYEKPDANKAQNHYVRVLYEHKEKIVPGCGGAYCALDDFQKAISKYMLDEDEYQRKCDITSDHLLESLPKAAKSNEKE